MAGSYGAPPLASRACPPRPWEPDDARRTAARGRRPRARLAGGLRRVGAPGTAWDPAALGADAAVEEGWVVAALTLVAAEVLESFTPPLGPSEHRRNVVTRGVDLEALVGRRFLVGEVLCEGRRPAEPCAHLERVAARPVLRALVHRGGLRADLLGGGTNRVGDAVSPV